MEKPNVTQLELNFSDNKEGSPATTVPPKDEKKEPPTLLMTAEEREKWKEDEPEGEYGESWQDIYNR